MGEAKRRNKRPENFRAKKSRSNATVFIIVVAIFVVVGLDVYRRVHDAPLTQFVEHRTKGQVEAPLQILEFADFQCPECARGSELIKEFMKKYPDAIRVSMNYFPLGELNSTISAVYAECAGQQGQFWLWHDLAFRRQNEWRTLLRIKNYFAEMAKELGLDGEQLAKCAESDAVKKTVQKDKALGESHFVKSTPTYFVNGEIVVGVESLRNRLIHFFEEYQELN